MNTLRSLQVNLTNTCAQKCVMCRKYEWPRDVLETDLVIAVIESLPPNATVLLSGGDPLMHPEVNLIIDRLVERKLGWAVLTNGVVFGDHLDGADYINISFDGATRETYAKVRGVDVFDRVWTHIQRYRERYPAKEILLDTTVSNLNFHEIPLLLEKARDLRMTINFQLVHTFGGLAPDRLELTRVLREALQLYGAGTPNSNLFIFMNSVYFGYPVSARCVAVDAHCVIDADATVFPCCRALNDNGHYEDRKKEWSLGNLHESSLDEIWEKSRLASNIGELRCKKGPFCEMCDRYVMFNSFTERYVQSEKVYL